MRELLWTGIEDPVNFKLTIKERDRYIIPTHDSRTRKNLFSPRSRRTMEPVLDQRKTNDWSRKSQREKNFFYCNSSPQYHRKFAPRTCPQQYSSGYSGSNSSNAKRCDVVDFWNRSRRHSYAKCGGTAVSGTRSFSS